MMTREQCRAARGLLGWPAKRLAEQAKVGVMTVSRLEAGQGETHQATRSVIQAALEAAGIEFIPENGGGAGVRMRKAHNVDP
jgi:DNA-binding LacI/PurR family transcriptional regulator